MTHSQYPLINDPNCYYPFLYDYPPNDLQLESSSQAKDILAHPTVTINQTSPNLFKCFLSTWAQNTSTPSLSGPPPPFHLSPPLTQAQPLSNQPTYNQTSKTHTNPISRKISTKTHRPSHFKPYGLARVNPQAPSSPPSSPSLQIYSSCSTNPYPIPSLDNFSPIDSTCLVVPSPPSFPSLPKKHPYSSNPSTMLSLANSQCPTAQSRGKEKSKWYYNEDDIPLAQLKKSRYGQNVSMDTLSNMEIATLSLTELQDFVLPKGPIQTFMASSLLGLQGQILGNLPQPLMPFALDVYIAFVLAASSPVTIAEKNNFSVAFVVVTLVTSHRFFKAFKGRHQIFNDAMCDNELNSLSSHAHVLSSLVDLEILEESLMRPSPPA
jgi:hypothetical protein